METVRALQVDAFTDEPLTGNAAGVVPDAEGLAAGQMAAIARELAVSETAFVLPSGSADRRIRYFTPTREIDLCGHATIATHAHQFADGVVDAGRSTLETGVGTLDVEIESDGTVWMTQDAPSIREVDLDYDRVAEALGVREHALSELEPDLPLAVASTGVPFLMVPATYLEQVGNADVDAGAVEAVADEVEADGVYLFTFDTLSEGAELHGRAFAPGIGIDEDPVTGTASGAVAAYLRRYDAFDGMPAEIAIEQGHFVDRPGRVRVRARDEIRVGGQGVTALDGEIVVPETDEDDIIEA